MQKGEKYFFPDRPGNRAISRIHSYRRCPGNRPIPLIGREDPGNDGEPIKSPESLAQIRFLGHFTDLLERPG